MYSLVWILILTDFDQPWPLLIPTSTTLDFHLDLYPTLTLTPTPMLNSDLELTSVPTFNNNSISHYHSRSHPVLDILHFTPHHSSLLYLIPTPHKLRWRKDLGAQHISWSRIVSQQLLCPDFNSNSNRTWWLPSVEIPSTLHYINPTFHNSSCISSCSVWSSYRSLQMQNHHKDNVLYIL